MGKGKGIYVILAIIALAGAYYFLIYKKRSYHLPFRAAPQPL